MPAQAVQNAEAVLAKNGFDGRIDGVYQRFDGWSVNGATLEPGATLSGLTADTTAYAQWTPAWRVLLRPNGAEGSGIDLRIPKASSSCAANEKNWNVCSPSADVTVLNASPLRVTVSVPVPVTRIVPEYPRFLPAAFDQPASSDPPGSVTTPPAPSNTSGDADATVTPFPRSTAYFGRQSNS